MIKPKSKKIKSKRTERKLLTEEGHLLPHDSVLSDDQCWWVGPTGKKLKPRYIRLPYSHNSRILFKWLLKLPELHKSISHFVAFENSLFERADLKINEILGEAKEKIFFETGKDDKTRGLITEIRFRKQADSFFKIEGLMSGISYSSRSSSLMGCQCPVFRLPPEVKECNDLFMRACKVSRKVGQLRTFFVELLLEYLIRSSLVPYHNKTIQFKINDETFMFRGKSHSWELLGSTTTEVEFDKLSLLKERHR